MAVSALPRPRSRSRQVAWSKPLRVPVAALATTLVAPTLDLLGRVQQMAELSRLGLDATAVATLLMAAIWLQHPRVSWLAAASVAGCTSLALRLAGAEVAPILSLLMVLALGIGGGFASPHREELLG